MQTKEKCFFYRVVDAALWETGSTFQVLTPAHFCLTQHWQSSTYRGSGEVPDVSRRCKSYTSQLDQMQTACSQIWSTSCQLPSSSAFVPPFLKSAALTPVLEKPNTYLSNFINLHTMSNLAFLLKTGWKLSPQSLSTETDHQTLWLQLSLHFFQSSLIWVEDLTPSSTIFFHIC